MFQLPQNNLIEGYSLRCLFPVSYLNAPPRTSLRIAERHRFQRDISALDAFVTVEKSRLHHLSLKSGSKVLDGYRRGRSSAQSANVIIKANFPL